ncbi:MAG: DUF3604 domain-containing protein [Promethearchaeota archaeon]
MHGENVDGTIGTASIWPGTPVVAGSKGTWKIKFTAGERGLLKNGVVRFTIPHGFTAPQSKAFYDPGFVTVESERDGDALEIYIASDIFCRLDRDTGHSGAWGRNVFVKVNDRNMVEGESITLTYGNSDYYGNEPFSRAGAWARELSGPAEFTVAVDIDGTRSAPFSGYTRVESQPSIEVRPGTPAIARLIVDSNIIKGKKIDGRLLIADNYHNPLKGNTFALTCNEADRERMHVTWNDKTIISNPFYMNDSNPTLKVFWGDIHGHTIHSDGVGSIDDYYTFARDVSMLDFSAITDHDDIGPRLSDDEWIMISKAAEKYYEPGRFVTFLGHEYRNGRCDMNVYYPSTRGDLLRGTDGDLGDAAVLARKVKQNEGMIVPHMHFGADWSGFDPEVFRVMEVYSQHGSAEYRGCPREIPYLRKQVQKTSASNKDCYIQDALNMGYKLGFTAGSDTHSARPGFSDWTRTCRTYMGGLTAVMATGATREEIWHALQSRNCYATTGNRSLLEFSINNARMGSQLYVKGGERRTVKIKCLADGFIEMMTVFRSGEAWIQEESSGNKIERTCIDEGRNETDWYYVRFDLKGGEMAWSSPIWIN